VLLGVAIGNHTIIGDGAVVRRMYLIMQLLPAILPE